ncbi:MAG: hypothetical protein WDA42_03770 [Candidatus Bathyarchaeia archaeon]
MSYELDDHKIKALRQMVNERKPDETVEEILTVFCARHSVSMRTCRYYYNKLFGKDKVVEQ